MTNKIMVTDSDFETKTEIVIASIPLERMRKDKHFISLVRYNLYPSLFLKIQNAQIKSIKEIIRYYPRTDMVVIELIATYTHFKERKQ